MEIQVKKPIDSDLNRAGSAHPGIVIVSGPTASGKSDLAVAIAEKYDGEVVNADSMQIYDCLRIGTARPDSELLARVPHHLFGVVSPEVNFSAADYCREARKTILSIVNRGKLPVVCGGTGLYIRVLLGGINDSPTADPAIREELTALAESGGNAALHAELAALDPVTAARLKINDRVRIIRAIEVYRQSGRPFSEFHSGHGFSEEWCRSLKIGIEVERSLLYSRIEQRVDRMFANGLVDEVRTLLAAGYSPLLKAMSSIGYKEVCACLAGRTSLPEAVALVKRNTRHYAKRQLTWFRRDADVNWYSYPQSAGEIFMAVETYLAAVSR